MTTRYSWRSCDWSIVPKRGWNIARTNREKVRKEIYLTLLYLRSLWEQMENIECSEHMLVMPYMMYWRLRITLEMIENKLDIEVIGERQLTEEEIASILADDGYDRPKDRWYWGASS